ncbi:MAG: 4Fe-4S binding protein, partial [Firmicutes bacterium]|nr:4Fe-4S binding protein [Bacillota bacterium]
SSNQFASEDCIRCGECVEACPFKLLSLAQTPSQQEGAPAA